MGHTWKALKKGPFGDVWVRGGGGRPEPCFFENWPLPLTVWGCFACSGQSSDTLHCTPTRGCTLGEGGEVPPPSYFGGGEFKKSMFWRKHPLLHGLRGICEPLGLFSAQREPPPPPPRSGGSWANNSLGGGGHRVIIEGLPPPPPHGISRGQAE